MSTGAVYIAANNDGQMDELLYMTGLLARRLGEIRRSRALMYAQMQQQGQDVSNFAITPTITDVTMSHNLLPSKTYRPYVTTTFQYLKHRVTTGSGALNGESTFQMRTFGEFLSDSLLYIVTSPVTSAQLILQNLVVANQSTWLPTNYVNYPTSTGQSNASQIAGSVFPSFSGISTSSLPAGATTGIAGTWTYNYFTIESGGPYGPNGASGALLSSSSTTSPVTPASNSQVLMDSGLVQANAAGSFALQVAAVYPTSIYVQDFVRYAQFPLHAMIMYVSFQINSVPIDSYTQERDNMHILYMLPTNKVNAYYKCVGQELPIDGTTQLITNYIVPSSVSIPGYPTGSTITARKGVSVLAGFQTPNATQPALTGIYPNKFDHCRDVCNAIPILAIPNTDRTFIYSFAAQSAVVYSVPANLFSVQRAVTYVCTGASNNLTPTGIATTVTKTPLTVGGAISALTFTTLQMYINNLFIDPSVHDIYLERIGFSLTRVHRIQQLNINTGQTENTLTSFKWPLEFMFIGLRPSTNLVNQPWDNWWKYTYNTDMVGVETAKVSSQALTPINAQAAADSYISQVSYATTEYIDYQFPYQTVDTMQITLQTIPLYDTTSSFFFNAYLPYIFGGYNISPGKEQSTMFVTFCFYPNDNGSPNGHVNVSRSREFVLSISSSVVGSGNLVNNGTLNVVGIVDNFWVCSAGNLYLRFT